MLNGYNIVRQKIEIQPKPIKNESFIYYETHMRVVVHNTNEIESLKTIAKKHKFHVSRNLFKKFDTFSYIMITYRSTDELNSFLENIVMMKSELDKSFKYDKIEIEECIFDTNQSIDVKWLSN
jgi:hypothetical protein